MHLSNWADRLDSLRKVPEVPSVLALETPRRMAAVTTLLALRFQWDGEAWTPPKATPAQVGSLPELPSTPFILNGARLYTADQMRAYAELARRGGA